MRTLGVLHDTFDIDAGNPHPSVKDYACAFCGLRKKNKNLKFCSLYCVDYAEITPKEKWDDPKADLTRCTETPESKYGE